MAGRDFEGWVVVVTGASTGLGRAIAVETAERGSAVVVINYASSQSKLNTGSDRRGDRALPAKTGQIVCYEKRTYRVLPTQLA